MATLSLNALEEQILALPVTDQLLLIERVARALRHENDRAAFPITNSCNLSLSSAFDPIKTDSSFTVFSLSALLTF